MSTSLSRVHNSFHCGTFSHVRPPLPIHLLHFVLMRAASYVLEPSTSTVFAALAEPLKLATETTFKRFDIDCDGQLTIDELHQMVTETASAFGLGAVSTHADSAHLAC